MEDIAAMLLWLNAERERREDVAEATGDIEDVVHGNVGPRILIIFEEQNLTVPKIKDASQEAFEALGDLNFAGRAARMNMVAIAQRYSAKAAGGGDVRATVNARILAGTRCPRGRCSPRRSRCPRRATPRAGCRGHRPGRRGSDPYTGGREAHDFALSGQVALCIEDMPARCAIGAGVPLGQLENTGPEQRLAVGQGQIQRSRRPGWWGCPRRLPRV